MWRFDRLGLSLPELAQIVTELEEKQVRDIKALLRYPDIQVSEVALRYGIFRTTLYKYVGAIKPREKNWSKVSEGVLGQLAVIDLAELTDCNQPEAACRELLLLCSDCCLLKPRHE